MQYQHSYSRQTLVYPKYPGRSQSTNWGSQKNQVVDAIFYSDWTQSDADKVENYILRTVYAITYIGCPVLWCGELQMEIYLSKT